MSETADALRIKFGLCRAVTRNGPRFQRHCYSAYGDLLLLHELQTDVLHVYIGVTTQGMVLLWHCVTFHVLEVRPLDVDASHLDPSIRVTNACICDEKDSSLKILAVTEVGTACVFLLDLALQREPTPQPEFSDEEDDLDLSRTSNDSIRSPTPQNVRFFAGSPSKLGPSPVFTGRNKEDYAIKGAVCVHRLRLLTVQESMFKKATHSAHPVKNCIVYHAESDMIISAEGTEVRGYSRLTLELQFRENLANIVRKLRTSEQSLMGDRKVAEQATVTSLCLSDVTDDILLFVGTQGGYVIRVDVRSHPQIAIFPKVLRSLTELRLNKPVLSHKEVPGDNKQNINNAPTNIARTSQRFKWSSLSKKNNPLLPSPQETRNVTPNAQSQNVIRAPLQSSTRDTYQKIRSDRSRTGSLAFDSPAALANGNSVDGPPTMGMGGQGNGSFLFSQSLMNDIHPTTMEEEEEGGETIDVSTHHHKIVIATTPFSEGPIAHHTTGGLVSVTSVTAKAVGNSKLIVLVTRSDGVTMMMNAAGNADPDILFLAPVETALNRVLTPAAWACLSEDASTMVNIDTNAVLRVWDVKTRRLIGQTSAANVGNAEHMYVRTHFLTIRSNDTWTLWDLNVDAESDGMDAKIAQMSSEKYARHLQSGVNEDDRFPNAIIPKIVSSRESSAAHSRTASTTLPKTDVTTDEKARSE